MKFNTIRAAIILGIVALLSSGCVAWQSDVDALRAEVNSLQSEVASAKSTASSAQSNASEAKSMAQQAQSCCEANREKMDRLFQKSQSK